MLDFERARFLMIEQQIRPWEVNDQDVLDLLAVVKRENFVPAAYRNMAFVDTEIPLAGQQAMFAPKIEAKILQALSVKKHENVLEIGTGSGYLAALFGHRARHVVSMEINPELAAQARTNLTTNGVLNVDVIESNGATGYTAQAPYDVICASGGISSVPAAWLEQLKVGGRLLAFVGEAPAMQTQLITRTSDTSFATVVLFETVVPMLSGMPTQSHFSF